MKGEVSRQGLGMDHVMEWIHLQEQLRRETETDRELNRTGEKEEWVEEEEKRDKGVRECYVWRFGLRVRARTLFSLVSPSELLPT